MKKIDVAATHIEGLQTYQIVNIITDVNGSELIYHAYNVDGKVVDSFCTEKIKAV